MGPPEERAERREYSNASEGWPGAGYSPLGLSAYVAMLLDEGFDEPRYEVLLASR